MESYMPTAGLLAAAIVFLIVLTIAWIVLPFAVFGIKKRLDRIIFLMESRRP